MPMTASRQASAASPHLLAGDGERRLQGRLGQVGQRRRRLGQLVQRAGRRGQVERGDAAAARAGRRPAGRRTPCARRAAAGATAATSSSPRSLGACAASRSVDASASARGGATRWSPRATRGPEDGQQPVLRRAAVAQGGDQLAHAVLARRRPSRAQRLHQPDQAEQGQVGVGDRAERVDERRRRRRRRSGSTSPASAGSSSSWSARAGVGEPQPGQLTRPARRRPRGGGHRLNLPSDGTAGQSRGR